MIRQKNKAITVFILCALASVSMAMPEDSAKPLNISANSSRLNFKTGLYTHKGHVTVDQGTTHLQAEIVTTQKDAQKKLQLLTAHEKPKTKEHAAVLAHYQTIPKRGDKILDARAQTIYYYPQEKKVILLGRALVTQGNNIYRGDKLVYDIKEQHIATSQTAKSQRSHFVIDTKDI